MKLSRRRPIHILLLSLAACDTNNVVGVATDGGAGDMDGSLLGDAFVPIQGSLGTIGEFCGTLGGGEVQHIAAASKTSTMAVAYASGFVVIRNAEGSITQTLAGHSGPLGAMSITSDGKMLATSRLGKIAIWDTATGARLFEITSSFRVNNLAFAPDDATLVSSDVSGIVAQWATMDGRAFWRTVFDNTIDSVHFLPDGSGLVASKGTRLVTLNASDGAIVREMTLGAGILPPRIAGISKNGKIAVGSTVGRVFAWSLETGAYAWVTEPVKHAGYAHGVDSQGEFVVVTRPNAAPQPGPATTTVALIRVTDGEVMGSASVDAKNTAIALLPRKPTIAVGTESGVIQMLEVPAGVSSPPIVAPADPVLALGSSAGGGGLVYGSDYPLNVWNPADGLLNEINLTSTWVVNRLALSPDSSMLAAIRSYRHEVQVVSAPPGETVAAFGEDVTSVTFSPDGQKLLTTCHCAGKRPAIQEWSVTGTLLSSLGPSTVNVSNAVYSPDGTRLALIASSGTTSAGIVTMFDVRANQVLWSAGPGHEGALWGLSGALAFSPDGTMLAFMDTRPTAAGDVTVFSSPSGAVLAHMTLPEGNNSETALNVRTGMLFPYLGGAIAFSPDQSHLAVAASKGVHVWRSSDWRAFDPIAIPATSLVFDRKRGTLMISDVDGSLRKWCGVGAALPQ